MADFEPAVEYVLSNEGGYSNDTVDHGGQTAYGITFAQAKAHGFDVASLTIDQAKSIYLADYWLPALAQLTDQRVADKVLDILVNTGVIGGTKIIQRGVSVPADGLFGPRTVSVLNDLDPETAIEQMSYSLSDYYVAIVRQESDQTAFLRGWMRRAIRRPK